MSKLEEILYEADKEGLRESVLKIVNTLNQTYHHMDMQDKVELAYIQIKNEIQSKQYPT
jgi:hypothetical protein